MVFEGATAVNPLIKAGKLKPLAVTTAQPTALVPGVPTMAASGLPGFECTLVSGVFAPARTPQAIIRQLNREIVRFLNTTEVKETFFNTGLEPVGSSPEQFATMVKVEMARMSNLIKDAGIHVD